MSRLPFPRTLSAFQSRFATEEACVHYLFESRWADGYACPRCGHDEAYELELRPKYANAGNAVTRSRLLRARCSIARDCPFGIGFRPPTWSPPTRQASLRCNCNGIEDLSAASLVGFLEQSVAPCSVVHTDGWGGYRPLANKGYDHRRETQGHAKNAVKLFPRVHRVFSNLKTWLAGTHHGVGEQHLQHYLNEYVFRFNRRRAPMAAFQSLLGLASQHQPTTYHMLYDGESTG